MKPRKLLLSIMILFAMGLLVGCFRKIVDGIPPEQVAWFTYKSIEYNSKDLYIANCDKTYVGITEENHSAIYFVGNKDMPNVIEIVGSDNTGIYKADTFSVDHEGTISKVLIDPGIRQKNDEILSNPSDIDMIIRLMEVDGKREKYTVSNYYTRGNAFYLEYDGCLVTDHENRGGYIANIDGNWIFVNPDNLADLQDLGNNIVTVDGILIRDEELIDWIESSDISKGIELY